MSWIDGPFGGFQTSQGRKILEGRPSGVGNRYKCDLCGLAYMSDEALQLHYLAHELRNLNGTLRELRDIFEGTEK
jgi:hypothetical protein